MKLEDVGFYTLSDTRAKSSSAKTPLCRCELLLTNRCNFKCPYCRGLSGGNDVKFSEAQRILGYWISERLQNVRFSGGEPTLYKKLPELVRMARDGAVKRIAVSTNGSNSMDLYRELIECGVNDFSISLDACCAGTGQTMSGKKNAWETVTRNIEMLSRLTYVSVGVVLNENNQHEARDIVVFAHSLGVSDIRIIPSAQYNQRLAMSLPEEILSAHPILRYRLGSNRHVRGIGINDSRKCRLMLDDMAAWEGKHYPCIIYLREKGLPIGDIGETTREDRMQWYMSHDTHADNICKNNCLDVCCFYNNTAESHD